ncbi:MAG: PD-(D/E)XK nuclease family protein, partial [Elusimicrobia bacterium]|nr:PD-(D/E)XK nuclease family protein [Elusimicrobiota bacterium]
RFHAALYYGFYDLTGLQLNFFQAVSSRLPTTLFFPYRRGHPAFRFADDFFKQVLAARSPQEAARAPGRAAVEPALDGLFCGQAPAALPDGALRLLSASGARDEVWAAAKEILALVDEGFCRFDEIGVTARSLEPYRAALAEVFEENAIPLELSAGQPLLRRPAAKLAWTLLSLARRDFPAMAVLDVLGSPYCARAADARRLSSWRLIVERLAIHAGWLQWRKLEARAPEELGLDAEAARSLWEIVSSWRRKLSGSQGSWAALAAGARELVCSELSLPADASPLEREALDLVLAQIDSLAAFDRLGLAASWEAFLDALERKLRASALAPESRRGVRALSAMDARGESFAVVFLLGLKEKGFPRQIPEDPLLREEARAALRHPAGYWTRPKRDGYEEERLLFYLCCACAGRRLYCVLPRSDEAGKAEVPSLYLRELCRSSGLELARAKRVPRLPFERLQSAPWALLSPREASLRLSSSDGCAAAAYGRRVGLPGELLAESLERLPELQRRGQPGAFDGIISPPRSYLASEERSGLSPTALDQLSRCPFQFFAQRLLGLDAGEEPADQSEVSPRLRGIIYHAALRRFYEGCPEDGAEWRPRLEAALKEVFSGYGWRELGVYPLLWRSIRDRMAERLSDFVSWDLAQSRQAGLRPLWLERPVSGTLPGGLKISGTVDRVDASPDRARVRVIDYKSSWKESLAKLVREGRHHQLPLYSMLVASELGLPQVESAAIFSVEDSPRATGRERMQALEAEELSGLAAGFLSGLNERVEGLRRGRFPIRPMEGEWGHCARCGFSTICRKAHAPSRARGER